MLGRSNTSNVTSNHLQQTHSPANGLHSQAGSPGGNQISNSNSGIGTSLQNDRVECSQGFDGEASSAGVTSTVQALAIDAGFRGSASSELTAAIECRDLAAVRAIVNAATDYCSLDPTGDTALFLAAELQQVDIVRILRDAGARICDDNQALAERSLRVAASEDSSVGVEAWVAAGVDINGKNQNQATALMLAAQRGHAKAVKALLKANADVDVFNKQGETALTLAAKQGHVDMVKLLRTAGAAIKPSQMTMSSRRLDESIRSGAWQVAVAWYSTALPKLSAYASAMSLDMGARGRNGSIGEVELLAVLSGIYLHADSLKQSEAELDLHFLNVHMAYSACCGRTELVKAFRLAGAEIPGPCAALAGRALRDATREGRLEAAKAWLAAGADVNALNQDGWTALFYSVSHLDTGLLRCLIDARADLDVADKDQETALMTAVKIRNYRAVEILLQNGASTELRDNQGRTAVNHAVREELFPMVESLLRAGAHISRSDLQTVALSLTRDLPAAPRSGAFLYSNAAQIAAARGMHLLDVKLIEMMLPFQEVTVLHV